MRRILHPVPPPRFESSQQQRRSQAMDATVRPDLLQVARPKLVGPLGRRRLEDHSVAQLHGSRTEWWVTAVPEPALTVLWRNRTHGLAGGADQSADGPKRQHAAWMRRAGRSGQNPHHAIHCDPVAPWPPWRTARPGRFQSTDQLTSFLRSRTPPLRQGCGALISSWLRFESLEGIRAAVRSCPGQGGSSSGQGTAPYAGAFADVALSSERRSVTPGRRPPPRERELGKRELRSLRP
jgi:hypothetical protein